MAFFFFFYLQLLSSDSGFTYSSCARINRVLLVAVAIGDEPNQSWAGIGVGNILWYGSGFRALVDKLYFFFLFLYKFAWHISGTGVRGREIRIEISHQL